MIKSNLFEILETKISVGLDRYMKLQKINDIAYLIKNRDSVRFTILRNELEYLNEMNIPDGTKSVCCVDLDLFWKLNYLYNRDKILFNDLSYLCLDRVFFNLNDTYKNNINCKYLEHKYNEALMSEKPLPFKMDSASRLRILNDSSLLIDVEGRAIPVGDYEEFTSRLIEIMFNQLPYKFSSEGVNFTKVQYISKLPKENLPHSLTGNDKVISGSRGLYITRESLYLVDLSIFKMSNIDEYIVQDSCTNL